MKGHEFSDNVFENGAERIQMNSICNVYDNRQVLYATSIPGETVWRRIAYRSNETVPFTRDCKCYFQKARKKIRFDYMQYLFT